MIGSIPIQQRPGQFCNGVELKGVCAAFLFSKAQWRGCARQNMPGAHTCFAAPAFFAGHFGQAATPKREALLRDEMRTRENAAHGMTGAA
ncbi:hypothetical protein VVD49_14835 [Uliginosibacterium sp. H3]|uniref:Uncharacterized protein n=1 Tax=Uliginosibacterium silvisoli TaxID=3114758 RepID=A0ABU6K5Z3_9RHOO|nr:hypothetical protein [Uliginosibacterium sp. H3]